MQLPNERGSGWVDGENVAGSMKAAVLVVVGELEFFEFAAELFTSEPFWVVVVVVVVPLLSLLDASQSFIFFSDDRSQCRS